MCPEGVRRLQEMPNETRRGSTVFVVTKDFIGEEDIKIKRLIKESESVV